MNDSITAYFLEENIYVRIAFLPLILYAFNENQTNKKQNLSCTIILFLSNLLANYTRGTMMINKKILTQPVFIFVVSALLITTGCVQKELIPKNIIFMIADGCGYNHVDAANIYRFGKIGTGIYEKFPVKYGMTTYAVGGEQYNPDSAWTDFNYVKKKPTDSAASATAMSTGVKTYNGAIGVDIDKKPLETIVERAERLGKASGVITSVQFNHATPAAFAAHKESRSNYSEIGREMILESQIDVIMGAGHPVYDDNGNELTDPDFAAWGGQENWQNLTAGRIGGDANGDGTPDLWHFISGREEFQALASGDTPIRVFGLAPVKSTLQQKRNGDENADIFSVPLNESAPTLTEMTLAAINVLDNDPDGFFLMIEGGAVDWASHDNQSGRMIEEKIDFDQAIEAVLGWIEAKSNWQETLVMITGDHETGYLNGPGSGDNAKLAEGGTEAVWVPLTNNGKGNLPGMEWYSTGHTNQLLPFYAKGAGSRRFVKYADQTDPVRGKYIDNGEIGLVMMELWSIDN